MVERPSSTQQKFVKAAEEKRLHLTELEHKMLKLPKKQFAADELTDPSNANGDPALEANNLNEIALRDKAQSKRKRAKVRKTWGLFFLLPDSNFEIEEK